MEFSKKYFILFLILLLVEVSIALFIKTGFIRHTFGDVLVVIMIYCFVRSFIAHEPRILAISVLLFSFIIEFLQLTNILEWLSLDKNKFTNIVLGNTFQLADLLAYTIGILILLFFEQILFRIKKQ